jgi:uncharacterized protein YraI
MKYYRLWPALWLGAALASPLLAEQVATVTGTRVNVRGQPTLRSEVITQLRSGDRVVVLEEITAADPKMGEPTRWARIQLPDTTTVFVFAPYVDPATKTVKVNRLNLRGGPGENFSVLGRLTRGERVKEVQTTASWMEIETPPEAHAFVALDFLEVEEPRPTIATAPGPVPPPADAPLLADWPPAAPPPVTPPVGSDIDVTEVEIEPIWPGVTPPRTDDWPGTEAGVLQVGVAPTVPMVEPEPPVEPTPRRVVIREGRVVVAFSPQAPTRFGLMSLETRRLINFLHSEVEGLNLRAFAGRDVFVTGEELLDARWVTPLIEVEDIRLAPKP